MEAVKSHSAKENEERLSLAEKISLGLDIDSFQDRMEARLRRVRDLKGDTDENREDKSEGLKIFKEEKVRS